MSFVKKTRTRTKVHCFCNNCKGALVDPRTKLRHKLKTINIQDVGPSEVSDEMYDTEINQADETNDNEMEYEPLPETLEITGQRNYIFLTKKMPINKSAHSQIVKKGKISDWVLENLISDGVNDEDDDDSKDFEDDEPNIEFDSSDEEEDFKNDDYEEINFASPDFDNDEVKLPPNLNDDICT
jgi:hypothetical protein